jgi:peptide alpha-N-acetyltransferase
MPPSASVSIPAQRALPPKEASLFRELLTLYEAKQLKKAQKTADQILKKFPEHGGMPSTDDQCFLSYGKRRDSMHEGPCAHPYG